MNGYSFAQGIVGVRASFLTDFIQRCGGAENLQGMTCYDVNEAHVKPSTRSMAVSVTKKMYLSPEAGWRNKVGKAQTIVSFSWQYPFLMVASTVASYVKRNVASLGQDPVIWMDLFSVNQHEIDTLPPEWFQVAHPENIKEIGSVTMMFAPSHSPSTFTRAWCVLEALSALLGSVPFAIAFSAEEESRLVNTVINDHRQLKTMVENSVKPIRSATCGRVGETNKIVAQANEITRSKIFEAIEREGYEGEKLVTALLELTKDAVTSALRQIAMQEDADMAKRGNLLKALGHIHLDEGMLAASIHMLELAVQTLTDASGKERRDTLAAMATLAEAYGKMGRFSEQHFLCEQVAFGAGNAFGKFHKQTLVAKCSAAVALGNTGRLEDALREQQSILQMKQDFLGADSEEVLASMFRVGEVQCKLGAYEAATTMLHACLDRQRKQLGFLHASAADTLQWLARAYKGLGRFADAEPLECECLNIRVMTLGEDHPETLAVKSAWNLTKQQLGGGPMLRQSFAEARLATKEEAM